nr:uncharacterized protein LOC104103545 [Nicotiana tomentosiformis]
MAGDNGPSLIMGDFNIILSSEDRVQGNAVQEIESGLKKWPTMEGINMYLGFSDHCPLSLVIDDTSQEGRRPFNFLNSLENHKDFDDIVKHCWRKRQRGTAMLKVWSKLKMLKGDLKQLNNQEFSSIGHKIQVARNKLEGIQAHMTILGNDNETILQEKAAKLELAKWLEVEESVLKQKSRIKWLKLGDSNTSYFHACMKNRQAKNHIGRLINSVEQILQSVNEVEEDILSFYKKLLGTRTSQSPVVIPEIMQSGYMLSRQQKLQLIKPVTREDVKKAVLDIDDNKAPTCDGYNSYFFKKTWHILGDEVTAAVMEFFENAEICKAINCTTITLIPKVKNPTSIKEFMPIS